MANDPILLDAGLKPPGHPDAFAQMGDVVWKVVGEDDVVSPFCLPLPASPLSSELACSDRYQTIDLELVVMLQLASKPIPSHSEKTTSTTFDNSPVLDFTCHIFERWI